jgi:hypothetical protein
VNKHEWQDIQGKHMIGSTFCEKNMIGTTFLEKTLLTAHSGKKY